jgi:Holliday junction resolvase RusA-like endonuclease
MGENRIFSFEIPGEPMGKLRHKQARGRVFNHPANVFYEGLVREIAGQAMQGAPIFSGPLRVVLRIHKEPPASWSDKKRKAAIGRWCPVKPDVDNVAKIVTDAMNGDRKTGAGKVYGDDAQIAYLEVTKVYAVHNAVDVTVQELGES